MMYEAYTGKHPTFFNIKAEFKRNKAGLLALWAIAVLVLFIVIGSVIIELCGSDRINLGQISRPPSAENILGTDPAGRDLFGQLLIGARNSLIISAEITVLSMLIATALGTMAGYLGGPLDYLIMRGCDFLSMLPRIMIIIVIVSIIPKYSMLSLSIIIASLSWNLDARYIRAKAMQTSGEVYVLAAKTYGISRIRILLWHIIPNIAPLLITGFTVNLAANMGIETSLSFLGFGLPFETPSLGTLIGYARTPENMQFRVWFWLPACSLILTLMLLINFVGQIVTKSMLELS